MTVTSFCEKQTYFMSRALEVSLRGRYYTAPNPWVGCIVVKHGEVIAEGHTQNYGSDHAEVQALKKAGEEAEDSTVYVTLEPCPNHGKTPPCTDLLIKAKVKKVVIGILDPDPHVNGRGVQALQDAGIEVEVGLLKDEIQECLRPYLHHRETGMPYCILKAAISMDGKIAAKNGSSIWITGQAARRDVHQMRAESQAILVGTNTILEDNPRLTVRHVQIEGLKPPLRVLIDSKGKIKPQGPLFDTEVAPTLIMTTKHAKPELIDEWKKFGCEVAIMPEGKTGKGVDLKSVLKFLGDRGVLQLLVEGGSRIFSSLIEERLVDKLVVYMGACLLGAEGISLFSNLGLESIDDAIRMHLNQLTRLGKDVRLDYTL